MQHVDGEMNYVDTSLYEPKFKTDLYPLQNSYFIISRYAKLM